MGEQFLTGIPAPEAPNERSTYSHAMNYFMELHRHPSQAERVQWACCKCGKSFRAHCGLDILKHGTIAPKGQP